MRFMLIVHCVGGRISNYAGSLWWIFWLFIQIPLALLCVLNELFPRFSHINRSNFFPLMCISHGSLSLIPGYHIMTIFIISTPIWPYWKLMEKANMYKFQIPTTKIFTSKNKLKQKSIETEKKSWSHISLVLRFKDF